MQPLRILLVDDQILFRKGIATLLADKAAFVVVGEAGDGLEALERVRETEPDLVLMDIDMPRCNGLEAVKRIKAEKPEVQIVMLTVSEDGDDLFEAIESGAQGYLLKTLEPQQLYQLLEGVQRNEAAISGPMAGKLLQKFRQGESGERETETEVDALTSREMQVLEKVADGSTNKEIAVALYITENTVKIHLRNILDKLHVANRVQAAVYAVRRGMLDEEEEKKSR
jgi:DNA-binding NarL/FixJ family response regulator